MRKIGLHSVRFLVILLVLALLQVTLASSFHSHEPKDASDTSCTLCIAHQDLTNGVPFAAWHPVWIDDSLKTILIREITLPFDSTLKVHPARAPPLFLV